MDLWENIYISIIIYTYIYTYLNDPNFKPYSETTPGRWESYLSVHWISIGMLGSNLVGGWPTPVKNGVMAIFAAKDEGFSARKMEASGWWLLLTNLWFMMEWVSNSWDDDIPNWIEK